MTPEKVLEVIGRYRAFLQDVPPEQGPFDDSPSVRDAMSHLHGMFDRMEDMATGDKEGVPRDIEKVMRWLGFVQGVLWLHGDFSLDQMREHNRCEEG
jgi:hypothetical protein